MEKPSSHHFNQVIEVNIVSTKTGQHPEPADIMH